MPLIPSIIKGTNLEQVNNFMIEVGVDVLHFDSAAKYGAIVNDESQAFSLYNEEGTLNITNGSTEFMGQLDLRFLGIQVNMPNDTKTKVTSSSQDRKNNLHNRFNDGVPVDVPVSKEDWDNYTEEEKLDKSEIYRLVQKYIELNNKIIENKTNELLTKIEAVRQPNGNYKINNLDALRDIVFQSLTQNPVDDATLDSIQYFFDNKSYLEAIQKSDKLKNVLSAIVQNKLISVKRTGTSLPQGSVKGFETTARTFSIPKDEKDKRQIQSSDELLFYPKINGQLAPMQVIIPLPEHLFNYVNSLADTFERGLEIFNRDVERVNTKFYTAQELNKQEQELFNIVRMKALRIPNQGAASTEIMLVKKFHHPMAQGIIVPTALVAKSGGDFDIDKLTIYYANTITTKEGQLYYKKDDLENELLEVESALVLHNNFINEYQLLSPTDDSLLKKKLVNDITKILAQNKDYMSKVVADEASIEDVFLPEINLQKFVDFYAGTMGIGQVAVHITQHSSAQITGQRIISPMYQIYFPTNAGGSVSGLYTQPIGNTKYLITEVLNALMSSQVDIGKDPYARKLGLNARTMNIALFMLRRGVNPELVFHFLAQPIIQDYISLEQRNESPFLKGNKNIVKKKSELIQELLDNYQLNKNVEQLDFDLKTNSPKFQNGYSELSISDLRDGLRGESRQESKNIKDIQFQIIDNFLFYTEQARQFQQFIRTASPDTSGEKTHEEVASTNRELIEVKNASIVSELEENKYFNNTILKNFLKARNLKYELFAPLSFTTVVPKLEQFGLMLAENVKGAKNKQKLMREIYEDFSTFIVQNYSDKKFNLEEYKQLAVGSASLPSRLAAIKDNKNHPLNKNKFIETLVPLINNKELSIGGETLKLNNLTPSSKSLPIPDVNSLQDEFGVIRLVDNKLYDDIIRYSIYQSGFAMSPYNYMSLMNIDLTTEYKIPAFNKAKSNLNQLDAKIEQFKDNFIAQHPKYASKYQYSDAPYKYYQDEFTNSFVLEANGKYLNPKRYSLYVKDYFTLPDIADNQLPSPNVFDIYDVDDSGLSNVTIEQPIVKEIPTQEVVDSGMDITIKSFYNSLSEVDKKKLGTLDNLINEYLEIPFSTNEKDFIETIKCRL